MLFSIYDSAAKKYAEEIRKTKYACIEIQAQIGHCVFQKYIMTLLAYKFEFNTC